MHVRPDLWTADALAQALVMMETDKTIRDGDPETVKFEKIEADL